jgi:hypothetical protein
MKLYFCIFLFFIILIEASRVAAVTVLSTDSGPTTETIKQGVSDGIFDSIAKHAGDWVSNGMNSIGNWALQTLFLIYDKYIGTFLIYIPDLASPQTYTALISTNGVAASNAVSVVLNILQITCGFGLYILFVGFVLDVGQRSSGLWNRPVEPSMVIGFSAAFICIFAWPVVHSYITNAITAMGYYVYNQNTLRTTGVLEGLQNIDLNSSGLNAVQSAQVNFRGNFITSQGMVWNLVYILSLGFVVIGFYNCYSAISGGDGKNGSYRFFQAIAGIILVLGVPTVIHAFISRGADTVSSQPAIPGETLQTFSLQGLIQDNGIQFPSQQTGATSNIGTAGNNPVAQPSSRVATFAAGLVKCGVSLWGLIVCFGVIFAKFFQILNIWVMFVLGPIFIGCLGHPATAPIFWGALRYFTKLLLYSIVWAITLVGLYLVPNINWGVETIGVNSLLTACAVLAGLQLISNVQEFASLFTSFQGANLKGEGYKDAIRDTAGAVGLANAARVKTFGGVKAVTGEAGQAAATAAGAAVGSVVPFVGTAGGAMAGQKIMKGIHMGAKFAGFSTKNRGEQGETNPTSSLIKRFSGDMISKNLAKDYNKNFSQKETANRQLIGAYARRLERSGTPPTNRGTGGDRRGGDGNPS